MPNYELLQFQDADALARAAADAWLDEVESANRNGRQFCVALSGGRIAQKLFTATVEQAKARTISLAPVHFFWADERCLPPTDPESNFKMADELLFRPLNISTDKIHRLRGEVSPQTAVEMAEEELRRIAPQNPARMPVLDLIFLGMGEDGHVASLFPNGPANFLDISVPFLVVENSPKPPPRRISLSYNAIKAAENLWILVSGAGKLAALRESLSPKADTPLARVITSEKAKFFSDILGF